MYTPLFTRFGPMKPAGWPEGRELRVSGPRPFKLARPGWIGRDDAPAHEF